MTVVRFCLHISVFLCRLVYIAFVVFDVPVYPGDQTKWVFFRVLTTLMYTLIISTTSSEYDGSVTIGAHIVWCMYNTTRFGNFADPCQPPTFCTSTRNFHRKYLWFGSRKSHVSIRGCDPLSSRPTVSSQTSPFLRFFFFHRSASSY